MKPHWQIKKLGEVCEMRRGLTYSKADEATVSSKVVLRSNNIDLDTHLMNFDELKYLKENFEFPTDKYIRDGELLMCMSNGSKAHLGKVALYKGVTKYAFGGFMSAIRHNNSVIDMFFYYALITPMFHDYIKTLSDGANINNLKARDILEYAIPLPPLAEQGEIVAYLDKEFALVDALREKAMGQLQAAKDLFQAILKQLLTPKDGWTISTIEESTTIKSGKRVPKGYKLEDCDAGHKYIRVADFDNFGSVDTSEIKYINETVFNQIKRYIITSQDVYISIAGTIGKTGIIPKELDGANLTENANRFILNKGINQRFFYYYTRSEIFQKEIKLSTTTSAQPKLAIMRLKKVSFAYPPLPEQESIVAQLDGLSEKCRQLEDNYRQNLTLCNDLKQALLKQVFE